MSLAKRTTGTVSFPLGVFHTAATKDDLEDWLLAHNPEFIKRMRKARKEDIDEKGRDWKTIKKELCIK